MSWDTKYRPVTYADVLGQESTVKILQQVVKSKRGFHQSYLFTGPFGTGKTTLGRILARALLCDAAVDGSPCDACPSCRELLRTGNSESFTEVDAATNSGKENIRRILETLEFVTFGGKRRIYLFDESHQLSRDSLDAMLKPLEDTQGDSEDRRLVCIFCTTEPEKMRETIGSRCGPTFAVHTVPPEKTVERLAWVCQKENVSFEKDALLRIAESVEGHIRDAFKACEMLSLQGGITLQNVELFLGQDLNTLYLDLLEGTLTSTPQLEALDKLLVRVSPAGVYEKLAKVCLLSYKVGMGLGKAPSYWDNTRLQKLYARLGGRLLDLVELFSTRPRRPTKEMLLCDFLSLQKRLQVGTVIAAPSIGVLQPAVEVSPTLVVPTVKNKDQTRSDPVPQMSQEGSYLTPLGVYNPPWGESESRRKAMQADIGKVVKDPPVNTDVNLRSAQFCTLVRTFVAELSKKAQTLGQTTSPDS